MGNNFVTSRKTFNLILKERAKLYIGYIIAPFYQSLLGQKQGKADSLRAIDNPSVSWHNRQKN